MPENKWTKPNRLTEVISHRVEPETVGSAPGYSKEMLAKYGLEVRDLEDGDTVWFVWLTTRTGLDKEDFGATAFLTEDEAINAVKSMPVGTIFGGECGLPLRFKKLIGGAPKKGYSHKLLSTMFGVCDQEAAFFTCYAALSEAGVISKETYQISQLVLDWLGQDSIEWMKAEFGENWTSVGELEYCLNHFPNSSLATLSAKLFVAYFVTNDDFTAGYLTKEIEAIAGGTEEAAVQSTEARKKAGEGGGRASRERKLSNLETLMQEIEALASVVGLMSEERILEQAQEQAAKRSGKMPKSKAILADYETTLRSEEPFKSRYEGVFRKNT